MEIGNSLHYQFASRSPFPGSCYNRLVSAYLRLWCWYTGMSLFNWADKKMAKLTWIDMGLTKLAVAAFALMMAKVWPPLLSLDWYWYGLIWILLAIIPLRNFWRDWTRNPTHCDGGYRWLFLRSQSCQQSDPSICPEYMTIIDSIDSEQGAIASGWPGNPVAII